MTVQQTHDFEWQYNKHMTLTDSTNTWPSIYEYYIHYWQQKYIVIIDSENIWLIVLSDSKNKNWNE